MRDGGVNNMKNYKIAVAGTGYVGLSIATLLSQHHQVTAVDIVPEKVELINNRKSPIQDDYIEKYLAEKELNLTAILDAKTALDRLIQNAIIRLFASVFVSGILYGVTLILMRNEIVLELISRVKRNIIKKRIE